MQAWMLLWKIVLIAGMVMFGIMAIWVTIWGAFDIKKLLQSINTEHETGTTEPPSDPVNKTLFSRHPYFTFASGYCRF